MQLSLILLILVIIYIIFTSKDKWEAFKIIISAGTIAILIRTILFQPFNIPSGSMIPTLLIGDFIFVSQYKYGYSKHSLPLSLPLIKDRILKKMPKRGDVVVFKTPRDNRTHYVKTLVGLPGDAVQVKKGIVYINDKEVKKYKIDPEYYIENKYVIDKDYVEIFSNGQKHIVRELQNNSSADNTIKFTVPNDHFFMMGDNRDNSIDSRALGYVGFIPFNNLVGKAEMIFFSIDKKKFGINKFWNWNIRFDRIGKIINKNINKHYEN